MIGPFVRHAWWTEHASSVRLVEVVTGRPDGATARPGVVVLDLDRDLSAPATTADGRHPLPSPEAFAATLQRRGIAADDTVVAFDVSGGVLAARLAWMLRAVGREAALLDGGLQPDDDPPVRDAPVRDAGSRPVPPVAWPAGLLADAEQATDAAHLVLDARPRERFHGAPDPLDPRPGHLPGAHSLPCRENLDADGRLLPDAVLRARLAAVGVDGVKPVVSTCGSGVTACHTLLVLEHLGLPAGRLYPGSWSQYAADPARPVEV